MLYSKVRNGDLQMKLNQYYKIGEAAEYLGVHRATLRNWDHSGVLKPKRTATGYRMYTRKQLDEVLKAVRESKK
jgi:excisionase family DNA binding protein